VNQRSAALESLNTCLIKSSSKRHLSPPNNCFLL
jgi:hypothetical protein